MIELWGMRNLDLIDCYALPAMARILTLVALDIAHGKYILTFLKLWGFAPAYIQISLAVAIPDAIAVLLPVCMHALVL